VPASTRDCRILKFTTVGASVSADVVKDADIVIKVNRPEAPELANYKRGALVIAIMDPYGNDAALKAMADAGISAFAMELMPRITRAQVMDVLSSQANLAGYRAVIEAAEALDLHLAQFGTIAFCHLLADKVGKAGIGRRSGIFHGNTAVVAGRGESRGPHRDDLLGVL
jgi:H+-translocating NAD(P) transhydrogenase subunit alpha